MYLYGRMQRGAVQLPERRVLAAGQRAGRVRHQQPLAARRASGRGRRRGAGRQRRAGGAQGPRPVFTQPLIQ